MPIYDSIKKEWTRQINDNYIFVGDNQTLRTPNAAIKGEQPVASPALKARFLLDLLYVYALTAQSFPNKPIANSKYDIATNARACAWDFHPIVPSFTAFTQKASCKTINPGDTTNNQSIPNT